MNIVIMVSGGLCILSASFLAGLIAGYYRMCTHLAEKPDSPWWVFIEKQRGKQSK